jgi:hypothetical protein
MAKLLNSTLFNGDYNYAEPMGINAGIRNNQVYNNLYYNAKPYNISNDLTTDPIITTSFKPQIEPSINRDKVGIPSIYPYTDTKNSFNIIPSYYSPAEFTPKCLINY